MCTLSLIYFIPAFMFCSLSAKVTIHWGTSIFTPLPIKALLKIEGKATDSLRPQLEPFHPPLFLDAHRGGFVPLGAGLAVFKNKYWVGQKVIAFSIKESPFIYSKENTVTSWPIQYLLSVLLIHSIVSDQKLAISPKLILIISYY